MAKSRERFDHGEHNEKVCELIAANKQFPDWVITTAFYAALHFVSYKIFPFEAGKEGGKIVIDTIERWQSFKSYTSNKRHDLLKDLVGSRCQDIYPEYDWLLGLSMTARYHNFQLPPENAEGAIRRMQKIKKACQPEAASKK